MGHRHPRDPRKAYKVRPVIETLFDKGSFFEMGRWFGRSIITAFARLDGRVVAVLASDPIFHGGSWTADACQKIVRFVDLAETLGLPVVYLMDCPVSRWGWMRRRRRRSAGVCGRWRR